MKIIRDGTEYELTATELAQAYRECEHRWDLEALSDMVDQLYEIDDTDKYAEYINLFQTEKEFADMVADRYRKYLDNYEYPDYIWDTFMDALKSAYEIGAWVTRG